VAEYLESVGLSTAGARSKSWDEFATADAPQMDLVITVCDQAAGEACPVWPGHPLTAHWGLPDPAAVQGEAAQRRAFADVARTLDARIRLLVELPLDHAERRSLQQRLRAIGTPAADAA
jgi:arsenate reductase